MLFNMIGYRLVFSLMEKKATQKIEAVIDGKSYTETNLVEIRIPLNMPYYSDKDYEAAYGETVINGKHYRYVKRKITGNTLFLLCIPNTEKTNLLAVKTAIEKNNSNADNEKPQQKNQQASVSKFLQAEFLQSNNQTQTNTSALLIQSLYAIQNSRVGNLFIPLTPAQPPELHI